MTIQATGYHSPAKRIKTRHSSQEADNEVSDDVKFEDPEGWGSPLTGLSTATPMPPSRNTASGSRTVEAGIPVSVDKKPKTSRKKKYGPDSQFNLDDTLLNKRLVEVGPDFQVDNDRITHQQVGPNSRLTMSHIFGGNTQKTISYASSENRRKHGFTFAMLFPCRDYNPHLPAKIGERGLLFRLDQRLEKWSDDEGGHGPYHLMMHHWSDDYCYFGVYEFVRVDPVTKDEWLAQIPQVRRSTPNHTPLTHGFRGR